MDTKELVDLQEIIVKELKKIIKSGDASAAHFSTAITLLKNNGINCDGLKNPEMGSLVDAMDFPVDVNSDEFINSGFKQ